MKLSYKTTYTTSNIRAYANCMIEFHDYDVVPRAVQGEQIRYIFKTPRKLFVLKCGRDHRVMSSNIKANYEWTLEELESMGLHVTGISKGY